MQSENTKNTEIAVGKAAEEPKDLGNATAEQQAATASKKPAKRKIAKKPKVIITSARRKLAVARARLMPGNGMITLNRQDIMTISNKYMRESLLEPVNLSGITADVAKNSNISINARGGGVSGQVQAARSAIAKAISEASKTDVVKKLYLDYDRSLLVDDIRQVEPKKFKGPKARARFQKSYR